MHSRIANLLWHGAAIFSALGPVRMAQAAPNSAPANDRAAGIARAGRQKLAVLELHDGGGIGETEARYLSERLRGVALNLPVEDWLIITRENLLALLPPGTDLADCLGNCEVATGRNIGADVIITGEFVRVGGRPRATLNAHRVDTGELLAQEVVAVARVAEMESALMEAAGRLFGRISGGPTVLLTGVSQLRLEGPAGAVVAVDGIELGALPLQPLIIQPGRHTITLMETRCFEGVAHEEILEADFESQVQFDPPAKTGEVEFSMRGPDGGSVPASLSVDGTFVGTVPGIHAISVCARTLTFAGDHPHTELSATVAVAFIRLKVGDRIHYKVRLWPPSAPAPRPAAYTWSPPAYQAPSEDDEPSHIKASHIFLLLGILCTLAGTLILGFVPDSDGGGDEFEDSKPSKPLSSERLAAGMILTVLGGGFAVGFFLAQDSKSDDDQSTARRLPSPGPVPGLTLGVTF